MTKAPGMGPLWEVLDNYVACSNIYLPDAIATLRHGVGALTREEACDRIEEAVTILACLLKLSQGAACELRAAGRAGSCTQEAEAVLKCLLQVSEQPLQRRGL